MNENENLMTEEVATEMAENAEQTAEETVIEEPKLYTEAELNARVDEIMSEAKPKIKARADAKARRKYEEEYGELMDVLRAGTGKTNAKEIAGSLKSFYESKGVSVPSTPKYSDGDVKVLAAHDADEIIRAGYDEVVEEVDRLAAIGAPKMSAREKALFKTLAEHRAGAERMRELSRIGVPKDVYESDSFQSFAAMFKSDVPIKDVYDNYIKTQPRKEIKTPGSMKNTGGSEGAVKDFYTREEALKFTRADFDKNPELLKAVERSIPKW